MNNLLHRPGSPLLKDVDTAIAALSAVFPIPGSHRSDLPFAVRDLSRLLTSERGGMHRSYWSSPRFLAAYLRYFLPWNLYRLSWLLPKLDAIRNRQKESGGLRVLDLGSGPLTLPLALWISRPDLRPVPLDFTCVDTSSRPMEIGLAALTGLAGGDSPWRFRLERASLESALSRGGRKWDCIMAGNVLNELQAGKGQSLEERLDSLAGMMIEKLSPGGSLLLIEPGTRLGGKTIALARNSALHRGTEILAPCTHRMACPMLAGRERSSDTVSYSGWCHFSLPALDVPRQLEDLGRKAGLEKDGLSLSCLVLRKQGTGRGYQLEAGSSVLEAAPRQGQAARTGRADKPEVRPSSDRYRKDTLPDELRELEDLYEEIMKDDQGSRAPQPVWGKRKDVPVANREEKGTDETSGHPFVRVISNPIRIPGMEAPCRYVCGVRGLGLLKDALHVPSGGAVRVVWPTGEIRDRKTGAIVLDRLPSAKELRSKGPKENA